MSQDLPVPLPEPSCVRSFYNDYKRAGAWHTKTSEPWSGTGAACGETEPMFTAEQMESYARACMAPLQAVLSEAGISIDKSEHGYTWTRHDKRADALEAALKSVVSHWREFGPEHGFDETLEMAGSSLISPTGGES